MRMTAEGENLSREPLVSIIIPTKNRRDLLLETLASVQAQTYPNWEAVVVDDASEDDTVSIVTELANRDSRLRLFRREGIQGGAQVCRNQGMGHAEGEFVIFLDSDDLLAPTCIENRALTMLAYPALDIALFAHRTFSRTIEDGRKVSPTRYLHCAASEFFTGNAFWQTTAPIWKKQFLLELGPWDEELEFGQDGEYHLRALSLSPTFGGTDVVDFYVRRDDDAGHIGTRWYTVSACDPGQRLFRAVRRRHSELRFGGFFQKRHTAFLYLMYCINFARCHPNGPQDLHDRIHRLWRDVVLYRLAGRVLFDAGNGIIALQRVRYLGGLLMRTVRYIQLANRFLLRLRFPSRHRRKCVCVPSTGMRLVIIPGATAVQHLPLHTDFSTSKRPIRSDRDATHLQTLGTASDILQSHGAAAPKQCDGKGGVGL